MFTKQLTMICVAFGLTAAPVTRAAADGGDLLGGIVGGVIGGVIVNEANKKRQTTTRTKTVYRSTGVSSAVRAERRETQMALNYFGFPAGTPDGVLGRNSQRAIAAYQLHMGYPSSGQLTEYEKDFLLTSYRRALAGGPVTNQQIAANPMGPKGLLTAYRNELAGAVTPQVQPTAPTVVVVAPEAEAAPETTMAAAEPALPNFMGGGEQMSLASHCNTVSLLTNTNGGFTTLASMSDPGVALNEQFCLARTYAIAKGEELAGKVQGFTPQQIAQQCEGFGPAMKDHVAALSLKTKDEVMKDVGGFVLQSGMSPAQLSGTAKICLSVGYRTDDLDVAIGSALLLAVLGEGAYGELMGHHLAQGFGASRRPDLALAWYEMGLDAIQGGSEAVFAPGQPERNDLIRQAAYTLNGKADAGAVPAPQGETAPLPVFAVDQ